MMISKEKEDYLFKLKAELLFRGKDEHEVNDIIEELRAVSYTHLTLPTTPYV